MTAFTWLYGPSQPPECPLCGLPVRPRYAYEHGPAWCGALLTAEVYRTRTGDYRDGDLYRQAVADWNQR